MAQALPAIPVLAVLEEQALHLASLGRLEEVEPSVGGFHQDMTVDVDHGVVCHATSLQALPASLHDSI